MKYIKITVTDENGETSYDATHLLQGSSPQQLEDTLSAFEDCLAEVHNIDPMVNALDFVDVVNP
tara:strand:+ start:277 stop:468 length:192 start_codon:yes stop_codon:yes gene_type:complete